MAGVKVSFAFNGLRSYWPARSSLYKKCCGASVDGAKLEFVCSFQHPSPIGQRSGRSDRDTHSIVYPVFNVYFSPCKTPCAPPWKKVQVKLSLNTSQGLHSPRVRRTSPEIVSRRHRASRGTTSFLVHHSFLPQDAFHGE